MDVTNGLENQVVSHYKILGKLGSGGMGDVFEAEDLRLGRRVALKFLPENLSTDEQAHQRFEREARMASSLNHPNICTIYEIDEQDGTPFIAMELLEGETLRMRLWSGPLPLNLLLESAIGMANALEAAHASSVIHRDLKPENVFLTRTGHAKVLDFGVAKLAEEQLRAAETVSVTAIPTVTYNHLTESGIVVGTTNYMSPEQVRGEELDARSDLFSFGSVLYEMATGKRAFPGATLGVICDAILNREPAPVLEINPQLPERLDEIIAKALEKDASVRYQSAADLRADLVRLKRSLDSDARISGGRVLTTRTQKFLTPERRRSLAIPALATVAVLALLATGALLFSRYKTPVAPAEGGSKQSRLTANPVENPVDGAALSPDGKYLAYSDRGGIHVKALAGGDMRTIPPPAGLPPGPNTWYPVAWFPDGAKFIATAVSGTSGSTWVIPLLGGSPQLLRENAWPQAVSPDGSHIAYLSDMDYAGAHAIWMMGANGENPRQIISGGPDVGFSSVSFSPDGNAIAYGKQGERSHMKKEVQMTGEIRDLQTGKALTFVDDARLQAPYWLQDGRMLYALARSINTADADLWAVSLGKDYEPKASPRRITNFPGFGFFAFSSSGDGTKLAFLRTNFESDVYVSDLDWKSMKMDKPRRLTLDDHNDMPTAWTPDGKAVIFFSDRDGALNVFKQALDSDNADALTSGMDYKWGPRLNSDGTAVHYLSSESAPMIETPMVSLKKVGLNGGPPETLLMGRSINDHRCSRGDGALCVFDELSDDRKTRTLFTYDEKKGRGRALISYDANPYSNWDLSPDGKLIAISRFSPQEARIRFLSLDGREIPDLVISGWAAINSLDWTPDGKGLLLSSSNSRGSTFLHVDLKGDARVLWSQSGGGTLWGVPSPDGKHLALLSGSFDSNVWMLENF